MSSLTASQAVFTDGSKGLVSNAITGTGNVVMSASPTLTGTIGAASQTLSGSLTIGTTLGVTGVATFTAQPILSSLTVSLPVFTDGSKGLVSNTMTGTGSVVMSNSPTLVTPALGTPASGVVTNLTGTASININGTVGATTPTTGAFTTITTSSTATIGGNLTVSGGSAIGLIITSSVTQSNLRFRSTFSSGGSNKDWTIVHSYDSYGDLLFRIGSAEGADPRTSGSTVMGLTSSGVSITGTLSVSSALTLAGGTLLTTSAALTNGAAGNTATLTNSPAAGNPTKWVPINDNGTTRYVPAW
jgi:hypothetical protein